VFGSSLRFCRSPLLQRGPPFLSRLGEPAVSLFATQNPRRMLPMPCMGLRGSVFCGRQLEVPSCISILRANTSGNFFPVLLSRDRRPRLRGQPSLIRLLFWAMPLRFDHVFFMPTSLPLWFSSTILNALPYPLLPWAEAVTPVPAFSRVLPDV